MGLFRLLARATIGLLTENGPGKWSIDGALGRARWGTGWALAALAAGAAGSAAVLAAAKQEAEKEVEQPTADRESVTATS
jgi:putative oxidoreductase